MKFSLIALSVIVVGSVLAIQIGSSRWNHKTAQLVERLILALPASEKKRVNFKELDHLPAPVARYFRYALKDGQPLIRMARIRHVGESRSRDTDNGWGPFESKQTFTAEPPGFVWDASIHMAPLMKVRVRDAYLAGHGMMLGKLLSLVPVVDEPVSAELDAGALQRYLAESAWFPTALLPSGRLKWSAIDDNKALAMLTDSGTTVSLEFHFNDVGEIAGIFTPGRYRKADGKYELTAWAGHFRKFEEREGMRIPTEGEVAWQLAGKNFSYWKGRIAQVVYDFER